MKVMDYERQIQGFLDERNAALDRADKAEAELASLKEPGEITDERIEAVAAEEWERLADKAPEDCQIYSEHLVAIVRRCLAIDRSARPAAKWVDNPSDEYVRLTEKNWRTVTCEWVERYGYFRVLMCPPVPPPTGGEGCS